MDTEAAAPNVQAATVQDVPPAPPPRPLSVGGQLSVSAIVPQEGYARGTPGMGLNGGVWIQMGHLVLEPRASARFDVVDDDRNYGHWIPLELGTYWLASFDQSAVYIGPAVNFQFVGEDVRLKRSVGSELVASNERWILEAGVCAGVAARAGVILGRGNPVSPTLSVEYALTFVDFEQTSVQRGIHINFGLLIGKGR